MEVDGGLPRVWADFLAHMTTMNRPPDYLPMCWQTMRLDACLFVDRWIKQIERNGWTPNDIRRLIPMLMGCEVTAVGMGGVTVRLPAGNDDKILWRPNPGGIAKWDAGRRQS